MYILCVLCVVRCLLLLPAMSIQRTPVACSAISVYVQYVCVCVRRFVQFADSGYEADPEIDRIEQQVSQCC